MPRKKKKDEKEEVEGKVLRLPPSRMPSAYLMGRSERFAKATTSGPGKAHSYPSPTKSRET